MAQKGGNERIKAFMADPGAQGILRGIAKPEEESAVIRCCTEAARTLGYDLKEEDFAAYLREQTEARKAKTEVQVKGIRELDDIEIDAVTGGSKDHEDCKDTYADMENCWLNDGCDQLINGYTDYLCHFTDKGKSCAVSFNRHPDF